MPMTPVRNWPSCLFEHNAHFNDMSYFKPEPYSEPVELLPGVDFTAGDLRDFRSRSGVKACTDACETEPNCSAFTFVKYSHPDPLERNMCWLKGEGFQ